MGFAYKITDQQGIHFITATVVQWVDVFTRKDYTEEYIYSSARDFYNRKGLLGAYHFLSFCAGEDVQRTGFILCSGCPMEHQEQRVNVAY